MKVKVKLIFCLGVLAINSIQAQSFEHYISVRNNKLMDGDKEFRFISFNTPNLNFIEDEMSFTALHPYRLPTEYEIRDVLLTVKQMGGQVVRIYTIPVKRADEPVDVPASVLGPGKFNEEAFKVNDLMLSIASELGIRIIFPIVNNWKWMGGRPQYAAFRGKSMDEFWTDRQIIEDVKKTIEYTLNRKNSITGISYKDDKTILCWETGNELQSPPSWTVEIARYIKEIDPNHLVMDGNSYPFINEIINEPAIDIITTHHYETDADQIIDHISKNIEVIADKKPYIIGEFGFLSTSALTSVMDYIISNHAIAGGLLWGLRGHREAGGFYWHSEPFGRGVYKAYHWPGFPSGNLYDEKNLMQVMRHKAFEIQGKQEPSVERPQQPVLLNMENVWDINWKGSAGALFYNIERSENNHGPWQVIGPGVNDAEIQYFPLYHDKTAEIGKQYYYRIIAFNASGMSTPSNISEPVYVKYQALIDNMQNEGSMYFSKNISMVTGSDRMFKEDLTRFECNDSSEVIYKIPGLLIEAKIYSFENNDSIALTFGLSSDNISYTGITAYGKVFFEGENDYNYQKPVLYIIKPENISEARFLKLGFKNKAQLARVTLIYKLM